MQFGAETKMPTTTLAGIVVWAAGCRLMSSQSTMAVATLHSLAHMETKGAMRGRELGR